MNLKKIWHFIWEDNSTASWIVNIILAFIIIKYLAYPALGLLLGTQYPIVAIMSGSMAQPLRFDDFWNTQCCVNANCEEHTTQAAIYEQHHITKQQFLNFPFPRGFNKGDIMVLYNPTNTKLGDILVFSVPGRTEPIIHRIISDDDNIYKTKGDHNCQSAGFEQRVYEKQAFGKAVFRIPYLGWLKVLFVELLQVI